MYINLKTVLEVEILVENDKFVSIEQTINELNNEMTTNVFEKFGASISDSKKGYRKIKTELKFDLTTIILRDLFILKQKMPSYIIDIYFY